MNDYFIKWLANGERGLSSETIATKLSGMDCMGFDSYLGERGGAARRPTPLGVG